MNTWADVINRANLVMEVMHERNAHNFPLDLAAGESTPVALVAPAINNRDRCNFWIDFTTLSQVF